MALAGLHPDDRVLDAGCGLGRVAWPVSRLLGANGTYHGFDTSAEYIRWCQNELGLDRDRFSFRQFDIRNSQYNPDGETEAEEFVFPWPDGAFTLVIASSLFTHLSAAAAGNYLSQIARTMDHSGRLFASFFVLDQEARNLLRTKDTFPPFRTQSPEGMLEDSANPDGAVAFDAVWLSEAIASAGLTFDAFYPGRWRQIAAVAHQDIIIARKK